MRKVKPPVSPEQHVRNACHFLGTQCHKEEDVSKLMDTLPDWIKDDTIFQFAVEGRKEAIKINTEYKSNRRKA